MKIVPGLGLTLALALGTAGCMQTVDAGSSAPTPPTIANLGLPSDGHALDASDGDAPAGAALDEAFDATTTTRTTTTTRPAAFVATASDFSAVFPSEPELHTQTITVGGRKLPYAFWSTEERGRLVAVGFVDYRTPSFDATGQDVLQAGLEGGATSVHGTILSSSPVDLVGAGGLDGVIEGDGFVLTVRLIAVGDRIWMLESVVDAGDQPGPEYQTLLETFQVL
jgi:hypothetical protein